MEKVSLLQDQIADAAVALFREKGYEGVSVGEICAAAGIARSSFYRAFSCKNDIIRRIFEHTDANAMVSVEELLAAENDFDRMWIIGDRYISLSRSLGSELSSTFMCMTSRGEIDLLALGHSVDSWFIRLTRNCQKTCLIRSSEPAEFLGPLMVDMVYHELYVWSMRKGNYPIRARARRVTEVLVDLAPEYRWTEQQLAEADSVGTRIAGDS